MDNPELWRATDVFRPRSRRSSAITFGGSRYAPPAAAPGSLRRAGIPEQTNIPAR